MLPDVVAWSMEHSRLDTAFVFAHRLHAAQRRKGAGAPYIAHLMSVCALVIEHGGSNDQAIAALLHDSIEDQGDGYPGGRAALREEIRQQFGEPVLSIVNDCTDDYDFEKGTAPDAAAETEQWRRRKQQYVDHLAKINGPALLVSCADKLHNARAILADYREMGPALWTRFRAANRENQLWYYSTLARIFREKRVGRLAEELARVVAEIEAA